MINKITFTSNNETIAKAIKRVSKKAYDYVGADKVYPATTKQIKTSEEYIHAGKIYDNVKITQKSQNKEILTPANYYTSPYMPTKIKDLRELEARENYTKSYPISHGTPEKEINGVKDSSSYYA